MPWTVIRTRIPLVACAEDDAEPVILIVTGDDALRQAAGRVFAANGYRVLTATHGGHAVLACLEAPRVDVLAVDLSMPDMSGPALAIRLKRHCPELACVFFGYPGTPEFDNVLVRPFAAEELLAAVASARAAAELRDTTSAF